MKPASFALASTLAAAIACAQPTLAQTPDQTGATNQGSGTMNGHAATNGTGRGGMTEGRGDDRQDTMRDNDEDSAATGGGNWNSRRPMTMGPMWRHRRLMLGGAGGAHFHVARGKARIDVTCSVQEDTEACVRAAGQLLDKIAELHGGRGSNTTGSAGHNEHPAAALPDDDDNTPGEERM